MDIWVKDLLYKKINIEKFQNPQVTRAIAIQELERRHVSGEIYVVGSQKHNIIHLVRPRTMWVAEYDIIADCPNGLTLTKECRKAQDWFWANTNYHKLEMTTTDKRIATMAKRLGWTEEGLKLESYNKYDTGEWLNEYIYGLLRPRN